MCQCINYDSQCINYDNLNDIVKQDGLKGALGSKKTETDKSTTVPVGEGPLPPPKPVSPHQLTAICSTFLLVYRVL